MYGLDGSFGQFAAFLQGCWMADARLLDGWSEWLVVQFDGGNNLAWQALVLRLALPDRTSLGTPLTNAEDNVASDRLFRMLDRFLDERDRCGGSAAIKATHQTWLKHQSWWDRTPTSAPDR